MGSETWPFWNFVIETFSVLRITYRWFEFEPVVFIRENKKYYFNCYASSKNWLIFLKPTSYTYHQQSWFYFSFNLWFKHVEVCTRVWFSWGIQKWRNNTNIALLRSFKKFRAAFKRTERNNAVNAKLAYRSIEDHIGYVELGHERSPGQGTL